MSGYGFEYHGLRLVARGSGALWWPEGRWLVVADLHLGKSERMARRGGPLLPPYEGRATLERLAAEVAALEPAAIVSLGDGFDDMAAAGAGLKAARIEAGRDEAPTNRSLGSSRGLLLRPLDEALASYHRDLELAPAWG